MSKSESVLITVLLLLSNVVSGADLYVAVSGSDTNQGTKDSPLATLKGARETIRFRKLAGNEPVIVIVTDGVYYLEDSLSFDAKDSGSKDNPIIYKAEKEGRVVLSGGSELNLSWEPYKDGIFKAKTGQNQTIDQLFINGQNQRMARYPNFESSKKAEPYQGYAADAFSNERAAKWMNPSGGYIHAMHRGSWGGYHYRITGKNNLGEVEYEGGWQNNRQSGMHAKYRMVENIFEELDAPGEWYHDQKNSVLYYKPEPSFDLENAKIEIVRLRHLIELEGTEEEPVRHIKFQGFKVQHAARTFMDCKEPLLRSDWAIYRGGAFFLTGTEDVSIKDCEFDQVGGNAIFVSNYNRRVLVSGCHIHDTGASGICFVGDPNAVRNPLFEYGQRNDLSKIDRTPGSKSNNYPKESIVENCLIHGIGRVERQPAGVQISMSENITIRDTSIYDTARAGINIGDGTWGGHLIDRCDVFDTVLETHDHGSFNSWGRDRYWRADHKTASQQAVDKDPSLPFLDAMNTTIIRNSRWRCEHGWDIDLDDGSSNYDIYNNLLLCGGLKLREGFRRHAWNNIIINNGLSSHVWFGNSKDQVTKNIMARANGPYLRIQVPVNGLVDQNFYYDENEKKIADNVKKFGWDKSSATGDPMFVDPTKGDFRVKDVSPAIRIGFENFPMDQFGVKKPSLKAIAKTPSFGPKNKTPSITIKKKLPSPRISRVWLGATLHSLQGQEFSAFGVSKEEGGVALQKIPKSSPADKAGLTQGDLIQGINGERISNTDQLFKALSRVASKELKLKIVRNQKTIEHTFIPESRVLIEQAGSAENFSQLSVPSATKNRITTNLNTNNEPLNTLTDGKLGEGYGPVFGNGIFNGAYKMDLGSVRPVTMITSWTHRTGNRAPQLLTIYGSNANTDPGWNLEKFTPLGTIDSGKTNAKFLAASLSATGENILGNFRWIVWSVAPVSDLGNGENSAFQELAVTIADEKPKAKASPKDQSSILPGEKSDFHGFDMHQFKVNNNHRVNVKVVCPKKAVEGKPWLWRSLFWEALPLVYKADLQLVEQGYHVVLVHGDVAGHPSGNANIDAAYELLTKNYGFSKKCSMASMSRGTLSLFRWASSNPDKVESIYVDNGVCNVLSWPAGKLVPGNNSIGSGDPGSWEYFKKKFGYKSDVEALKTKESPIDLLQPLAKAGVPILMVCGNKDRAVPYEENDAIMEKRYKALGGTIKVIIENKGHSHGMKDPTPILEFVKENTE
jgi:hypothetical protein